MGCASLPHLQAVARCRYKLSCRQQAHNACMQMLLLFCIDAHPAACPEFIAAYLQAGMAGAVAMQRTAVAAEAAVLLPPAVARGPSMVLITQLHTNAKCPTWVVQDESRASGTPLVGCCPLIASTRQGTREGVWHPTQAALVHRPERCAVAAPAHVSLRVAWAHLRARRRRRRSWPSSRTRSRWRSSSAPTAYPSPTWRRPGTRTRCGPRTRESHTVSRCPSAARWAARGLTPVPPCRPVAGGAVELLAGRGVCESLPPPFCTRGSAGLLIKPAAKVSAAGMPS